MVGGKTRYLAGLKAGVNDPVQYMASCIPKRLAFRSDATLG